MLPIAVLAGGLATRLRPITDRIPKSLVEVAGRPFIDWQLEAFSQQGIERIVVCTGYLGEMVQDHIGDGARFGLEVLFSPDGPRLLGTGGALRQAAPFWENNLLLYTETHSYQSALKRSSKPSGHHIYRHSCQC